MNVVTIELERGSPPESLDFIAWKDDRLSFYAKPHNDNPSTHPLHGPELRALRRLQRDYPDCPYVFTGERKGPLTSSTVRKLLARAGKAAGLEFPVHPHMLHHATGYNLAMDGVDTRAIQCYLGHRNIGHTVRYTELSPERFKDFWQD